MRILIAGDWHSDLHEEEVRRSLLRLGCQVGVFKWFEYYNKINISDWDTSNLFVRAQNKFVSGPIIVNINRDLLSKVTSFLPDVLFIYRGTHILAQTLIEIKKSFPDCILVGYNNDDPFAPRQPNYLWRHFLVSVPIYDLMLAYRHANIESYFKIGAKRVELLRSWFVPDRNFPVTLTDEEKSEFETDIVFVGHYEQDQRLNYLEEIIRHGFRLRIFGPTKYWHRPINDSSLLKTLGPIKMAWGLDYNRALCGAKIALCFLSKLNRDTYTRRSFEIPATRTFMFSEHSDDIESIYIEGVEAEFFRNKKEFIDKIKNYMNDVSSRNLISNKGFEKVWSAGHDIDSRMQHFINLILSIKI